MRQVLEFASGQSIGRRNRQEDRSAFVPPETYGTDRTQGAAGLLMVLADGMGGHSGGDIAAMTTVESVVTCLREQWSMHPAGLEPSLNAATAQLAERKAGGIPSDMGSTLVAAIIRAGRLYWISVGDSHLYRISGSSIMKLNADHSMAPILDAAAGRGEITPEEARTSEQRNVLLSAVTGDAVRKVDLALDGVIVQQGDWILAASDGLDVLPTGLVASIVASSSSARHACQALLDLVEAENNPHQDNTTIMCARIVELADNAQYSEDLGKTRPMP